MQVMLMWLIEKEGQRREKTLVYGVDPTCLHQREELLKSKLLDSYIGSNLEALLHALRLFLVYSVSTRITVNGFANSN